MSVHCVKVAALKATLSVPVVENHFGRLGVGLKGQLPLSMDIRLQSRRRYADRARCTSVSGF
ncbi:MAG: hypothetical protein CM15mP120_12530 [Pseudomonadota bacterium]|nr:MAG: hypothetical protein CM15mP120_12530 [Pseudomonadota bacterium]